MAENQDTDGIPKFPYSELGDELDRLDKELNDMKETVSNTCVRAHMTEVELAMLFNPQLLGTLKTAERACGACVQALDQQTDNTQLQMTVVDTGAKK